MHRSITGTYLKHFAGVHDGAADVMPLTGAQRRFHHTRSADPRDRVRILPVFVEFPPGLVSTDRLERAARSVLLRHPVLRGAADTAGGLPVLRIGPVPAGPLVQEITGAGDTDAAAWAALEDWPAERGAFRVLLARDDRRDLLVLGFDHLVCDGESTGPVLDELMSRYRGGEPVSDTEADAERDRYRDVVQRQLAKEHEASDPEAVAHWTSRVRDAGPGRWGRDRDPGGTGGQVSAWHRVALPETGTDRPFPLVLAACHTALARLPGTAPVAYTWGGHDGDGPGVVGCFINTVLANPQGDGVRESWWEDLEFVDTPFDEVVRAARAADAPWTGHLDLVLTFIDHTRRTTPVCDGESGRFRYPPGNRIEDPMIVTAAHEEGELSLRIDRDPTIVPDADATGVTDVLRERAGEVGG